MDTDEKSIDISISEKKPKKRGRKPKSSSLKSSDEKKITKKRGRKPKNIKNVEPKIPKKEEESQQVKF